MALCGTRDANVDFAGSNGIEGGNHRVIHTAAFDGVAVDVLSPSNVAHAGGFQFLQRSMKFGLDAQRILHSRRAGRGDNSFQHDESMLEKRNRAFVRPGLKKVCANIVKHKSAHVCLLTFS
jgi:hypothetical protein